MRDQKQALSVGLAGVRGDQVTGAAGIAHRLPFDLETQRFEFGAHHLPDLFDPFEVERAAILVDQHSRSEEHTYELTSLMLISYACFCWKQKNIQQPADTTIQ